MNKSIRSFAFIVASLGVAQSASAENRIAREFLAQLRGHGSMSTARVPDGANQFFSDLAAAERRGATTSGVQRENGEAGPILRQSFSDSRDQQLTGEIRVLARNRDASAGITETAIQIQPLPAGAHVVSSDIDLTSMYMHYGRTEMVFNRVVAAGDGRSIHFDDFYHVTRDESGLAWGVRNRRDMKVDEVHVTTESWDGNRIVVDVDLPANARVAGRVLSEPANFTREFRLPDTERGFVVFHELNIASRELVVRTSSGHEYIYSIALTLEKASGTRVSPPQYRIDYSLKEGSPRRMAASELLPYRARRTVLGARQMPESGLNAGDMQIELSAEATGLAPGRNIEIRQGPPPVREHYQPAVRLDGGPAVAAD